MSERIYFTTCFSCGLPWPCPNHPPRNGMTDDEREFLQQKADGRIPLDTGWNEWRIATRRAGPEGWRLPE